jgi:hypothetical protein
VLESDDYNGDGVNNTQDLRDAFNENPQGFPGNHIVSTIAKWDPDNDSLTAMVAEISPEAPCLTFRTNSYEDLIPGDNLYAANSSIKRNNAHNYCSRYYDMTYHIGEGTSIGTQENWELMAEYSHTSGYNYMFCQHLPDSNIFKVSNARDNTQAYLLPPLELDLNELFASPANVHTPVQEIIGINLFPNPTNDKVTIETEGEEDGFLGIEMYNSMGSLVQSIYSAHGKQKITLDLAAYPAGLYFIHLKTKTGLSITKVIKY